MERKIGLAVLTAVGVFVLVYVMISMYVSSATKPTGWIPGASDQFYADMSMKMERARELGNNAVLYSAIAAIFIGGLTLLVVPTSKSGKQITAPPSNAIVSPTQNAIPQVTKIVAQSTTMHTGLKCPHCGADNLNANKFCGQCGKSMLPSPPAEKKCSHCGTVNAPEYKFCDVCGTPLTTPTIGEPLLAQRSVVPLVIGSGEFVRCPVCNKKNYATAVSCEKCGIGFHA